MRQNEAVWLDKYGYWRIQVQKDGKRKAFYSSKAGTRGKAEAERKADKWLKDGEEHKTVRFEQLKDEYLSHLRTANGTAHKTREEQVIRLYLPWAGRKISSLTNIDYQEAIDACVEGREKPLSARTCGHVRTTIQALYRYARKAGYKMAEPFGLTIPRAATKGQRTILQTDGIKKVFADNSYYAPIFRFIIITGLRPGEVCGLQKADLQDATLTIRRARNMHGELTTGKNENARRTIVLPQQALGCIRPNGTEWLFVNAHGRPLDERALYSAWQRARERLGLGTVSLYELRHTMISMCKDDLPLAMLKQVVGHSGSMDTLGTYGHEKTGEKQTAAAMIEKVFSEIVR